MGAAKFAFGVICSNFEKYWFSLKIDFLEKRLRMPFA